MLASAFPPQDLPSAYHLHPRGFIKAAALTCARCGYLFNVRQLNRFVGVCKCPNCYAKYSLGIIVRVLPTSPGRTQSLPSDAALHPYERSLQSMRSRSRTSLIRELQAVGLADPMPQLPLERFVAGEPANRLEIVSPPTTSCDPADT